MTDIELSVVVPVYRCADCLVLRRRLTRVLEATVASFELVFIDDRSLDDRWAVLIASRARPSRRAFRLSRNFGQDAAITAGLAKASGAWAVVMDCDLQEPPEDIPRLLEKARRGTTSSFRGGSGASSRGGDAPQDAPTSGCGTSSCGWRWARSTAR